MIDAKTITLRIARQPWFLATAAAIAVWLALVVGSGINSALTILPVAFSFAVLFVIVGVGQMFVMSSGPGNIDLSIPMVMTLAAYLATGQMRGDDVGLALGVLVGLGTGTAFGLINALLIRGLKTPPMIATLAVGLIAQSAAFVYAHRGITKPSPLLEALATGRFYGLPLLPSIAIVASIGIAYIIRRSIYARSVFAHGQNPKAASLAGIRVEWTMSLTYAISGFTAGLAGILVAAFQGGASLSMASEYLLISIAVVVIGGTPVTGGSATIVGTWSAAVFLFLLLSLLNSFRVEIGVRNVITGLMIIVVLALASRLGKSARSRAPKRDESIMRVNEE